MFFVFKHSHQFFFIVVCQAESVKIKATFWLWHKHFLLSVQWSVSVYQTLKYKKYFWYIHNHHHNKVVILPAELKLLLNMSSVFVFPSRTKKLNHISPGLSVYFLCSKSAIHFHLKDLVLIFFCFKPFSCFNIYSFNVLYILGAAPFIKCGTEHSFFDNVWFCSCSTLRRK